MPSLAAARFSTLNLARSATPAPTTPHAGATTSAWPTRPATPNSIPPPCAAWAVLSLLHDGRAATLEDVFLKNNHPQNIDMTPAEVADLVTFLKSL